MDYTEQYDQLTRENDLIKQADKDGLKTEFKETEKEPDFDKFVFSKIDKETYLKEQTENDHKTAEITAKTGIAVLTPQTEKERQIKRLQAEFAEKVNNGTLAPEFYSHSLKDTPTAKSLNKIQEAANLFRERVKQADQYKQPEITAKIVLQQLSKVAPETAVKVANKLISDNGNIYLDITGDSELQTKWQAMKSQFNSLLNFEPEQTPTKSKPPETLPDIITHEKSKEIGDRIKSQYRNIKGKRLKLLLLALQDLDLIPKGRYNKRFYRACKNTFDWQIGSYQSVNDYHYNQYTDKAEKEQMTAFLNDTIKDK